MTDRYRRKPVVVEARQWLPGDLERAGYIICWLMAYGADFHHPDGQGETTTLAIRTLKGDITAEPGDWIVSLHGEFGVCDPIAFAAIYEPADGAP